MVRLNPRPNRGTLVVDDDGTSLKRFYGTIKDADTTITMHKQEARTLLAVSTAASPRWSMPTQRSLRASRPPACLLRGRKDTARGAMWLSAATRDHRHDVRGSPTDSVDRTFLWAVLQSVAVPPINSTLSVFNQFHDGMLARVRTDDGVSSEPFRVELGLRQGCIPPPLLFNYLSWPCYV